MVRWSGLKRWLDRRWRLSILWMKNLGRIIGFAILVALLLTLFRVDQDKLSWAEWTGLGADSTINIERDSTGKIIKTVEVPQSGKSLWDLLSVLVFPGLLAFLGIRFQQLQQKQASEEAKEEILQVYFDRISTLLIDKNVIAIAIKIEKEKESQEEGASSAFSSIAVTEEEKELVNASVDVIRARTLSMLRRLGEDRERKGDVVRFLAETEIVSKLKLDLRGVDLSRVNLNGINLSHINLSNANLSNIDLSNATLISVTFSRANLGSANLRSANLNKAFLNNADLRDSDLSYTNLDGANLNGANLSNANLNDAVLSGSTLINANLNNANLSKAFLNRSDIRSADLSDANLSGADFTKVNYDGSTKFPNNIDPTARGMLKIER